MKYIIKYKERGDKWRTTSYTSNGETSYEYLVSFFGLREDDIEDFRIEIDND